ncbi:cuticle protein 19-like [Atheta coriaria]|uniref:cuticle protein 19-like n=1 Tax=Dalotia coriaria TaxID=877792 RepID=UPI0031F38542
MFKCLFAVVFVVVFINNAQCYPPAESYQQVNLGGKTLGLSLSRKSLGLELGGETSKLIQIVQQPILIKESEPQIDYIAYPKYGFKYGVSDPKTGDNKEQQEERDGDVVKGEYSLVEPDGTKRIVKYTADKKNGFNAEVIRAGHAIHPQVVSVQKVITVPVKSWGGDSY